MKWACQLNLAIIFVLWLWKAPSHSNPCIKIQSIQHFRRSSQDTMGGRFDVTQSLMGELSDLQFWSRVLTPNEIYNQATCGGHLVGDVMAWSQESVELHGGLTEVPFDPCHWGLTLDPHTQSCSIIIHTFCDYMPVSKIVGKRDNVVLSWIKDGGIIYFIAFSGFHHIGLHKFNNTSSAMGNRQSKELFCFFNIFLPFLFDLSAFSTYTLTSSLWRFQQDDFKGSKERRALDLPAVWSWLRLLSERSNTHNRISFHQNRSKGCLLPLARLH